MGSCRPDRNQYPLQPTAAAPTPENNTPARRRRIGIEQGEARSDMDRFVSNYTLRLDAKGRVSIPAAYRAVLARDGFDGLYVYPTLDRPALDAGGNALLGEIEEVVGRFPPFSDEREGFSAALYGTSETLKIDGEGRVVLSEPLKSHAGIEETAAFVGLGHKFQIWEPERFRAQLAEATGKVRALKKQLGSRMAAEDPHGARE
jgi:MraZ protein